MLRTLAALLLAMAVASPPSSTAWAQRPTTRVSLAVGGSFVNFSDVGGRMGAGVGQVAITRHSSGGYGVELAGFGVAPWGAVSVQPTCLPDSSCDTRSTPSLLTGATLSPTARLGSSGLFIAGGVIAAVGIVLLIVPAVRKSRAAQALQPQVSPTHVGLGFTHRF